MRPAVPGEAMVPRFVRTGEGVGFLQFRGSKRVRAAHARRLVVLGNVSSAGTNPRPVRLLGMAHAAVLNQFRPFSVGRNVGNGLVVLAFVAVSFAAHVFLLLPVEALAGMALGAVMDADGFAARLLGMGTRVVFTVRWFAFAHRHFGIS